MKILVTGGSGQLGRSVARRGAAQGHEVVAFGVAHLDITDSRQIAEHLDAVAPALVINAAAYTAVDRAEGERERAFQVNAAAPGELARACVTHQVPLLHVSTDYVFDGTATRPYTEDDPLAPLGVYGESKAAGERAVLDHGGTVVRTSWLFAARGPSFVQTMVRLATERPALRVVDDQRGCPTWAEDLADALLALAGKPERAALYHYCNDGEVTWHGFATAIVDEARRYRALACDRIDAITTAEYPTPARRPVYSVLDTARIRGLGIVPPSWRPGLARVIAEDLGGT
ncbi:MAG: dTDP-4-dehydrorhamnose reductase [Myxococcota bacterium]|nr:dTDP-4-dehydrorhamnose reductase [Myxococcota bacterium]